MSTIVNMNLVIVLVVILSDCVASQSVTCSRNGIEKKLKELQDLTFSVNMRINAGMRVLLS